MNQRPFPYLQSVYFSLTMFIDHFSIFFPLTCAWALLFFGVKYIIVPIISLIAGPVLSAVLFNILLIILFLVFIYQLLKISFALYKREPISLSLFYETPVSMFQFLYSRLLYLIGVILGLILLLVPGFFVAAHYYFSGFSLLANETTSVYSDAQKAIVLSQGCLWQLLFAYLVKTSLFTLFFMFFFYVGFFVPLFLIPITTLIDVHLYFTLKSSSQDIP